jgi:virginiamycin B lyase
MTLTPRDPEAFRADVLRRAVHIERRRRRARILLALPALGAVVLLAVVFQQRSPSSPQVAANTDAGGLTSEEISVGGSPWGVVGGTDGAVWVLTRVAGGSALTRVGDEGDRSDVALPAGAMPESIVAGTDEAIWATDPPNHRVVRVDRDLEVHTYSVGGTPSGSATWLDGRFWFADAAADRITSVTSSGATKSYAVPTGRAPTVLTSGPDGAVWYASSTSGRIGSVSSTGAVNELDLGEPDDRVTSMAPGPGPAVWLVVTRPSGARLAHVDAQGKVVGDELATSAVPVAVSLGPDGRMWFATGDGTVQQQTANKVSVRPLGRPVRGDAWALTRDDAMWVVDRGRHLVLRITLD